MDRYFCVFRMPGQLNSSSVSFESEHPGTAILKMMSLANVTNTMDIEEAEILKVVRNSEGAPAYEKVFEKRADDVKGKVVLSHTKPVIDTTVVEKQLDIYKRPYEIEVL